MAVTLNDTLSVKRGDIKHYDFGLPFWQATRQKKLVIQYCKTAKKYQHFPRPVSIFTGRRRDREWKEVSGKGTVYTYSVMERANPPYCIAYVELAEGPKMMTNIVDIDPKDVKIGMKVKVKWIQTEDNGPPMPCFAPA